MTTPNGLQHPLETLELESAKDHLRKACSNYALASLRAISDERPFNGNDIARWSEAAENALCEEVLSVVHEMERRRSRRARRGRGSWGSGGTRCFRQP